MKLHKIMWLITIIYLIYYLYQVYQSIQHHVIASHVKSLGFILIALWGISQTLTSSYKKSKREEDLKNSLQNH